MSSWEAFRWTAKSPSELYHVLGPHGVDELIRHALATCWRESPAEGRTIASVKRTAQEVFDRNMKVWSAIKKPSPDAFFKDLLPNEADGFMRQALVLCWMMMPRAGGRKVADARKIVTQIFNRNLAAWDQDHRTFTAARPARVKRATPKRPTKRKSAGRKRTAR